VCALCRVAARLRVGRDGRRPQGAHRGDHGETMREIRCPPPKRSGLAIACLTAIAVLSHSCVDAPRVQAQASVVETDQAGRLQRCRTRRPAASSANPAGPSDRLRGGVHQAEHVGRSLEDGCPEQPDPGRREPGLRPGSLTNMPLREVIRIAYGSSPSDLGRARLDPDRGLRHCRQG